MTRFLTTFPKPLCVIDAHLLDIRLFRISRYTPICFQSEYYNLTSTGLPRDNPNHPLDFCRTRRDVLTLGEPDKHENYHHITLDLAHDGVWEVLRLTATQYNPLPDDKTAYEGQGPNGPYKPKILPYSISNIGEAKQIILEYIERTKMIYIRKLVDRTNEPLFHTFMYARKHRVRYTPLLLRMFLCCD